MYHQKRRYGGLRHHLEPLLNVDGQKSCHQEALHNFLSFFWCITHKYSSCSNALKNKKKNIWTAKSCFQWNVTTCWWLNWHCKMVPYNKKNQDRSPIKILALYLRWYKRLRKKSVKNRPFFTLIYYCHKK